MSPAQRWGGWFTTAAPLASERDAARLSERGRLAEMAEDAAIEAAIEEAEQQGGASAAADMEEEAAAAEAVAPPPAEQLPQEVAAPPLPRFMEHSEQRLDLGKPLWSAVAAKIPRVGHDGTLHMPRLQWNPKNLT